MLLSEFINLKEKPGCNMTKSGRACAVHGLNECPGYKMIEDSAREKLHKRHQELRKKSGLPDPEYYKELKASYDLPDEERLARVKEIKKKYNVNEAGPFSYGAKKPRKGSVADLAAKKRKEQERDKQPVEPRDHMVGVARVVKEMDKSAPQPGRDGKVSHSTYGSRDKKGSDYFKGKEAPGKSITKKEMEKYALDILKKQGVAEGSETNKYQVVVKGQKRSYSVWVEAKNEEVAIIRAQQYVAREHNDHGTRAGVVDMKKGVAEGLNEMDKSAPQPGRDGSVSHKTYGSRDKQSNAGGKEHTAKAVTAKQASKDALNILKKQGVAEGSEDIIAVIDGVRSDRTYNDKDHAHNSLGKLVAYGKAKIAELYVNGEKVEHFELGKKYREFEPKSLDSTMSESSGVTKLNDYNTWSDQVDTLGAEKHMQKNRTLIVAQSWDGERVGEFDTRANQGWVMSQSVQEGRKPDYNFDIEDIKKLEQVRDLETLKTLALQLISKPSAKPMKPEKVEWFKSALERMDSPLKVIKLMYDLLLSGEGHSVIGSRKSMNPNTYRQRFGEDQVTNEDVEKYLEEMQRAGYEVLHEESHSCPECGGPAFSDQVLAEKKDACYSKVKSRYKVWPSAYASGALVRCRKVGAKNWGNKSKK